jgi:hypothetical protein
MYSVLQLFDRARVIQCATLYDPQQFPALRGLTGNKIGPAHGRFQQRESISESRSVKREGTQVMSFRTCEHGVAIERAEKQRPAKILRETWQGRPAC